MTSTALGSIRVMGLTSIKDLTLDLPTAVTVLIGPNGSGKSNIVGALEWLGRIIDGQLQETVVRRGGFANLLYQSATADGSATRVYIEAWGRAGQGQENGYQATLEPARGDEAVIYETSSLRDPESGQEHSKASLGVARESRLRDSALDPSSDGLGVAHGVLPFLTACRVFHFEDTSPDAPVKRRGNLADDLFLAPDASNLAPLLNRLHQDEPTVYRRIVRAIQTVAPFFDDFVLKAETGSILLRWREKGLDNVFSADELSDGTMRFICLATLLLQPERPGTVVLDEPELGLHPFAINQLAGLIRAASTEGGKVIIATQSVTLLSHFDADELAIVERGSNGTTVNRLNVNELADWLAEYSLGELWEKNVLGGRPRPDSAAPPAKPVIR